MNTADLNSTLTRALLDSERASLAAAAAAYQRGEILQREVSDGVWVLVRSGT